MLEILGVGFFDVGVKIVKEDKWVFLEMVELKLYMLVKVVEFFCVRGWWNYIYRW